MSISTDNETLQLVIIIGVVALLLGVSAGYFSFRAFADLNNYYQIKYVAESEIMELEKTRVAFESKIPNLKERNLFFGNIDRAVELTARIAASHNGPRAKVVYSLFPVFADGVESISREVHEEVIEQMQETKE